MSQEYAEDSVEKVSAPPLVHDATLPLATDDNGAGPKTGVLIAVVGTPIPDGTIKYDATLGYCVWVAGTSSGTGFAWLYLTGINGDGDTVLITDENGEPILAFAPI